jgi:hypothetical protein
VLSGAIGLAGEDSDGYGEVLGESALIALAAGAGSALLGLVTGVVIDELQDGHAELETLTRGERIRLLEDVTGLPGPPLERRCEEPRGDPPPPPPEEPSPEEPEEAPGAVPTEPEAPAVEPTPAVEPPPVAEPPPAVEPAPAVEAPEQPAGLECPPDTRVVELASADGKIEFCARTGADGVPVPHGPSLEWFVNGAKAAEGDYLDGAMHGPWTAWHPSGVVRMHAMYDRGARCGTWVEYDQAGEEQRVVEFAPCAGGRSP